MLVSVRLESSRALPVSWVTVACQPERVASDSGLFSDCTSRPGPGRASVTIVSGRLNQPAGPGRSLSRDPGRLSSPGTCLGSESPESARAFSQEGHGRRRRGPSKDDAMSFVSGPSRLSQPAGGHFKLSVSASGLASVSGSPTESARATPRRTTRGSRQSTSRTARSGSLMRLPHPSALRPSGLTSVPVRRRSRRRPPRPFRRPPRLWPRPPNPRPDGVWRPRARRAAALPSFIGGRTRAGSSGASGAAAGGLSPPTCTSSATRAGRR